MRFFVSFILIGGLFFPSFLECYMTSTNYTIYADDVSAGGSYGSVGDFVLEDTVGGNSVDISTTTTYTVQAGYQFMDYGSLSITISPSSINLGNLGTGSISSSQTTVIVSANSNTGYSLSITGVSGLAINAVSDNQVTAGNEEYGIRASGSDIPVGINGVDVAVTEGLVLASNSAVVSGNRTTLLDFKASISNSTVAGSYSQTLTLTASANI